MERQWRPSDLARWLRRRRKTRHARDTGETVGMYDADFYEPDGDHRDFDDQLVGLRTMAAFVAILLALTLVGFLLFGTLGGGDDDVIGSPPTTAAPASTAAGSSAAPASTEAPASTDAPEPSVASDPLLDVYWRILSELGLTGVSDDLEDMEAVVDLLNDFVDSLKSVIPAYQGRDVDIARVLTLVYEASQGFQDLGFNNSVYECGALAPLVVCPPGVLDMPAGTTLVVGMEVAGPIPIASEERAYRYSVVFDTDGDPANDWVYVDPFEWDYFQGADRWYEAVYDPAFGWTIQVTQLTADGSIPGEFTPSAARVVVDEQWLVWFIPVDELGGAPAPYRVAAFGHDGAFSEDSRGGDVLGPDPTGALFDPPTEPVFVAGG